MHISNLTSQTSDSKSDHFRFWETLSDFLRRLIWDRMSNMSDLKRLDVSNVGFGQNVKNWAASLGMHEQTTKVPNAYYLLTPTFANHLPAGPDREMPGLVYRIKPNKCLKLWTIQSDHFLQKGCVIGG